MLTRKQCAKCESKDIKTDGATIEALFKALCLNCGAYTFDGEVWISPPSLNWRNDNGD
jgi:hypothetical protein